MPTITDARRAIAQAVSSTGLACQEYPMDNMTLPAAFLNSANVAYDVLAWSFCANGVGTFEVVTLAQRNDMPSGLAWLEQRIPVIAEALETIGVRISGIESGTVSMGGQDLPAVTYTVTLGI